VRAALADGRCGLLVPPGDEQALAAAVLRAIGDAELRQELAHCARQRACSEFSLEAMGQRYLDLVDRNKF